MSRTRNMRFLTCRAQTNVVATFLILTILLFVTVPFLLYYVNSVSTTSAISMTSNNYKHLKDLQVSQVEVGSPSLLYTGSLLIVWYSNSTYMSPTNFTVTGILYLNTSGVWKNVTTLKYPIVVTEFTVIPLPSYAQDRPILVVTSLGNLFFLTPNTGIGAAPSRLGKTNGFGVTILAQVTTNKGQQIPIITNLVVSNVTGTSTTYSTPVLLNYTPAYFYVEAPLKTTIPSIGDITFSNWVVIGNAKYSVSTGTSNSTIYIHMLGNYVAVIANYTHP